MGKSTEKKNKKNCILEERIVVDDYLRSGQYISRLYWEDILAEDIESKNNRLIHTVKMNDSLIKKHSLLKESSNNNDEDDEEGLTLI